MKYNEYKIFMDRDCEEISIVPVKQLCMVPGEAFCPQAAVVFTKKNMMELFQASNNIRLYAAFNSMKDTFSDWYESEDEVLASNAGKSIMDEGGQIVSSVLYAQRLYPLALPLVVLLQEGARGLFCRMNFRPDLNQSQKLYFPDRSCENVFPGPFVVESVNDKGNYGFLRGHMLKLCAPSKEQLVRFLKFNQKYWNATIFFMESDKLGSFVRIHGEYFVVAGGYIQPYPLLEYCNIPETAVTQRVSVRDFLCEEIHGCTYEQLVEQFVLPQFESSVYTLSGKYISDVFDEACKRLVSIRKYGSIEYAVLDQEELLNAAMRFSEDELRHIVTEFNRLNTLANERFISLVRKGRIKVC